MLIPNQKKFNSEIAEKEFILIVGKAKMMLFKLQLKDDTMQAIIERRVSELAYTAKEFTGFSCFNKLLFHS